MKNLKSLVKLAALIVTAMAVAQELKKPQEDREWHGRVFDFIPYDFRLPTLAMFLDAYWNPENPTIFTDKVLGVGWSVNFGRLYKLASEGLTAPDHPAQH